MVDLRYQYFLRSAYAAVGQYAHAAGSNSIAIGSFCSASHTQSIVLGASAASQNTNSFNIPSGFSAYVGSSSWSTSDDRLKHNEALITNGLAVIRQIAPKCYQKSRSMFLTGDDGLDIVDASGNRTPYGADFNGIMEGPEGDKWFNDAGVIAQEMHTVLPNFVTVGDENRPWSVNYNALFSYSLSAVKELDAIVQELRDLNTALTARVAALES